MLLLTAGTGTGTQWRAQKIEMLPSLVEAHPRSRAMSGLSDGKMML